MRQEGSLSESQVEVNIFKNLVTVLLSLPMNDHKTIQVIKDETFHRGKQGFKASKWII